jgi:hypothetical protein
VERAQQASSFRRHIVRRKTDNRFHAWRDSRPCIPIHVIGWLYSATKSSVTNLHERQTATLPRFGLGAILSEVVDEFLQVACEFLRCLQRERKSGSQVQDSGLATEF